MADSNSHELKRLATIERNEGKDQLRISLDEFTSDDGKTHQYISIRKWYSKDGQWLPTKAGVTVRQREIMEVGKALKAGLDAMADGNRFAPSNRQPTAPQSANMPGDPDWDSVM